MSPLEYDPDPFREDDRTLGLASARLTADDVERLVLYLEAIGTVGTLGPEGLAAAHRDSLIASGFEPARLESALASVRRFAGNRRVARRLAATLEGEPDGSERRRDLTQQLARLEAALTRREDASTLAALRTHEERLLPLHARFLSLG